MANRDVDQFPRNFLEKLKEGSLEEEEEEEEGREMERGVNFVEKKEKRGGKKKGEEKKKKDGRTKDFSTKGNVNCSCFCGGDLSLSFSLSLSLSRPVLSAGNHISTVNDAITAPVAI